MHLLRLSNRSVIALTIAALVLLFQMSVQAAPKPNPSSQQEQASPADPDESGRQYVGSEQCQACHDETYKSLAASPHALTLQKTNMAPGGHGCESCHGPGSEHVAGGGDKSKIFRFTQAKSEQISRRCLTCHEANLEQQQFLRSVHGENGISCTSCHSIHHARKEHLLTVSQPALCFSCHAAQRADFMKPFRHRVLEGLIKCSDCHNPHGTTYLMASGRGAQLRSTPDQNDICYKCHADKRGPFVFEHEPVRVEGCTTCHFPHGSTNPRMLLTARVNALCLQCHSQIPSPTSLHAQQGFRQSCIICHASIHGSNTSRILFQ